MILFHQSELAGVLRVEMTPACDERGSFARLFCSEIFAARSLCADWRQINLSRSTQAGVLRGLHWQCEPDGEAKLVCCQRGHVYDVAVDLRRDSPQFGQWVAHELREGDALYLCAGMAHGVQSLSGETELLYLMSAPHRPLSARGLRWDDPDLAIPWPVRPPAILSARDRAWPCLSELAGADLPC